MSEMEDILARIIELHKLYNDPERAHGEEDRIYRNVLEWIVAHSNDEDAIHLAKMALTTQALDFPRWCA